MAASRPPHHDENCSEGLNTTDFLSHNEDSLGPVQFNSSSYVQWLSHPFWPKGKQQDRKGPHNLALFFLPHPVPILADTENLEPKVCRLWSTGRSHSSFGVLTKPSTSHSKQKPKIFLEVHSPNHSHQNISWKSVKAFIFRCASTRKPSTTKWDLKESEQKFLFRAHVSPE